MKNQLGVDEWREAPVGESLDADLRQIAIQITPFISAAPDPQTPQPPATVAGIITGSPNALCVRAPDGSPVILFDASLGALLAVLSLATVVADIRLHDPRFERHPGLKGRLPANTILAEVAAEAISGFISQRPRMPDLRRLAGDASGLIFAALSLAHGEIRFAVAHEFGHVTLGHLDAGSLRKHRIMPETESLIVDAFVKGHQQEFAADLFGANLCWRLAKDVDPPDFLHDYPGTYGLGTELFFLHLHLLERVSGTTADTRTHPPSRERLAAVRQSTRPLMTDEQVEAVTRCQAAVSELERLAIP